MNWMARIEYELIPRCYESQFRGADILPADVIHSPYTYGGKGRVFCGLCSRQLTDEQINALSRFSTGQGVTADKIARSWK